MELLLVGNMKPLFEATVQLLDPFLKRLGAENKLKWENMCDLLSHVDDVDEALSYIDPTNSAKMLLIISARAVIEPRLARQGLSWKEIAPLLDTLDSLEDVVEVQ